MVTDRQAAACAETAIGGRPGCLLCLAHTGKYQANRSGTSIQLPMSWLDLPKSAHLADVQDLNPPLYSSYHLSFTSALPRSLLEELASLILADDPTGGTGQLISSVHDQFLDFLVPSPNLFSLLPRREVQSDSTVTAASSKKGNKAAPAEKEVEGRPSYVVLNDPRASELDIEEEVERIAKGLFSVAVTMCELHRSQ